jgi:phosphinothricin acetyltransferase
MRAIYGPVVRETVISFEFEVPSEEEFRQRIANTLERRPWLVCEVGGEVAGYAYAAAHRERAAYQWSVEPSVYVGSDHRRRGVASALYKALFAALRAQGFYNAYAGITLPNASSIALHEAFGFERIGVYHNVGYKFGVWHDVAWYELALRRDPEEPAPVLSMAELLETGILKVK